MDLQAIGKWLKEYDVRTVAMESTGVYWIPLFEELERQGFECLLISSALAGEREPQKLAALREPSCKKSEEEIGKALTGTWREEHLFVLKQSMEMYVFYTQQIQSCDEEIERVYGETRPDWDAGELKPLSVRKRSSHSKNKPQNSESIRKHLKRISGVDLSVVEGFGVSLAQTVIMECGTDMGKFPSEKHFCSWLGLAPKHEISGGKVLKNKTLKTKNRAGQAFRMAANSVKQADCVFGVMYRRLKARLGPAQATVATAHAIARVVYRMLKYQVEYETISVEEYEKKYMEQQLKYMKKRAKKLVYGVKNLTMGINLRRRLSLVIVDDASQDISPPYWIISVLFSSWN